MLSSVSIGNTEPIEIKGSVSSCDIGEDMELIINDYVGHPFLYILITIYLDGVYSDSYKVISKYITRDTYKITNPFYKANVKREIRIVFNYVDIEDDIDSTFVTLYMTNPSYSTFETSPIDVKEYSFSNNTFVKKVNFECKGRNSTKYYEYEAAKITNSTGLVKKESRIIDFSKYNFIYIGVDNIDLDSCEIRIYKEFEDSDLEYRDDYTSIYLSLKEISENTFQIVNEYKFYIDETTGMIYESYHSGVNEDLMPFFLPFSLGFSGKIKYQIIFKDIGFFHTNYVYNGEFDLTSRVTMEASFGGEYNYKYVEINEILEGVRYA